MTSQQPTGHDKADWLAYIFGGYVATYPEDAHEILAALRAALAAGDADVAEALGLKGQWSATDLTSVELDQKPTIDGWPTREQAEALFVHDGDDVLLRRFVTDWTEVPGE